MLKNTPKLEPCPFCGGEAVLEQCEGKATGDIRWSVGCSADEPDCMGYQSLTTFATINEAVKAWNKRTLRGLILAEDSRPLLIYHDFIYTTIEDTNT